MLFAVTSYDELWISRRTNFHSTSIRWGH